MPDGAREANGFGKFLIPGFWDMHVHSGSKEFFFQIFIADGVTVGRMISKPEIAKLLADLETMAEGK